MSLLTLICFAGFAYAQITDPLGGSATTFRQLFKNIFQEILKLIGGIGTIMVIISGLMYLLSAGNPGMITKAKSTLLYACIGMFVGQAADGFTKFFMKTTKMGQASGPEEIFLAITDEVKMIVGGLSVIMFIVAGIQYLLSSGNPNKMATARTTLTFAIIGLVLSLTAGSIVTIFTK